LEDLVPSIFRVMPKHPNLALKLPLVYIGTKRRIIKLWLFMAAQLSPYALSGLWLFMAAQLSPYALSGLYGQMLIITTEYFVYILQY
jgi:hypothetical protein